jgi:hypothetical protein
MGGRSWLLSLFFSFLCLFSVSLSLCLGVGISTIRPGGCIDRPTHGFGSLSVYDIGLVLLFSEARKHHRLIRLFCTYIPPSASKVSRVTKAVLEPCVSLGIDTHEPGSEQNDCMHVLTVHTICTHVRTVPQVTQTIHFRPGMFSLLPLSFGVTSSIDISIAS